MKNPVAYLKVKKNSEEYGVTKDGWYFWDETWGYAYGPHDTESKANTALQKYCKNLNYEEPTND